MTVKEQKALALEMYPTNSMQDIMAATGLDKMKIKQYANAAKVRKQGFTGEKPHYYKHLQEILKMYPTTRNDVICEKFGISKATLTQLASKHGIRKQDKYSNVKDFIKANYQTMSNEELAKITGISKGAVGSMANQISLKKKMRHIKLPEYYKHSEDILKRYPVEDNETICSDYGITESQLTGFANRHGVTKRRNKISIVKHLVVEQNQEKPTEKELEGFFDDDDFFSKFP